MYASDANVIEKARARLTGMTKTDPELGKLIPSEDVTRAISEPGLADHEVIRRILEGYADRPALARRAYEIVEDPATGLRERSYLPAFSKLSYGDVLERVEALASAWRHHDRHGVASGEFVATFGFTGVDYAVADIACVFARNVIVPLQANLAKADLVQMLKETGPRALITHVDHLDIVVDLALGQDSVRSIIAMETDVRDDSDLARIDTARQTLARAGSSIEVTTLDDLIDYGRGFSWAPPPPHPDGDKRLAAVMYTSGSTGTPKGAILTEYYTRTMCWTLVGPPTPSVALSYAPMNHMMGRLGVFQPLVQGGTVYFTLNSDMSTLLEDIRLARPTSFSFLPRIATMVYQTFQNEVMSRMNGDADRAAVEAEVMAEMRSTFLGDRLWMGSLGSAPTPPEVKRFIEECFAIAFVEGYGTTEAGTVAIASRILRTQVTDYKLRDVPELGYFSTDKPYPRGELLIKSKLNIPGYFKHPELDNVLYDEDGYQCTGDVVEERGPDEILWLDRKNNVLKLAQGEYVAVGPLEASYVGASPLIKQVYLYGNSYRSYLLAAVVPDMNIVVGLLGKEPDEAELRATMRIAIQNAAQDLKLRSFEIPRDVIVDLEPFTYENGLLSSMRKPLRPNLKRKYGERLEDLYEQMERKQQEDLATLKRPDAGMSTLVRLGKVLEASLGTGDIDLSRATSFAELGGDSMSAVSFSLLAEDIFGVPLPVSAILSPAGSPQRWARIIDRALGGDDGRSAPGVADVHGEDPHLLRASDLDLSAFLDLDALGTPAPPSSDPARNMLLTGASGYLGRFLCMEWLEHAARVGGKLFCIIRAGDAAAARRRLEGVLGSDPDLERRFQELAANHLEVLAGDLTELRFGLDEATYQRLAHEIDQIVHPAALVNHRLSYQHLFDPNVVGTAELIRLALTGRMKRFDFVSSLGVVLSADDPSQMSESGDIRESRPTASVGEAYGSGYSASKWAGEVLLREAHDHYGLPVNIFRSDMILAHQRYRGQINVPDIFSRLLQSIAITGLAPESFYQVGPDGKRAEAHYDGLPVDFIARAMFAVGARPYGEFGSYNVVNVHHDDGISLDRIVDWIGTAGYPVERIAPHGAWVDMFRLKLRNLPDDQRQHSALEVMDAYARPAPARDLVVKSDAFVGVLRETSSGLDIPHLSEAFIHKCLDDLCEAGVLARPSAVHSATSAGPKDVYA
jgi:fatty acid CoA ligase FadD9